MPTEPAVTVVRPRLPRWAVLGDRLAEWLEEGVAARRPQRTGAAVVLVPEYLRACPRTVLADLAGTDWSGTVVARVGYGGRTRGRFAIEDAREVLDAADVLLRDLLGALRARAQKRSP